MTRLIGKCALVTGGGSGIGRASAVALAEAGADVAVADLNLEGARETVAGIERLGRRAVALRTDVSRKDEVLAMVDGAVAALGRIDILFNNAGINRPARLQQMREEDWDLVIDVHLKGTFLCTQAAVPGMLERRYGKIVNVSSIAGKSGAPGGVNYAAAKAGIIGFTKTAAKELAKHNVTVNVILPGVIDTPMSQAVPEKYQRAQFGEIPLGRVGRPEELAAVVVFLASDESSYVTGTALEVSGGLWM